MAYFDDARKRRKLAKAIVEQFSNKSIAFELTHPWPRLIRIEDFDWLVKELISSVSQPTESKWAELVWSLFNSFTLSSSTLEIIVGAREMSPKLREKSKLFFKPVEIGSERAQKMKDEYYKTQEFLERRKKPKVMDWLPQDRIKHYLNLFEAGKLDAWWLLLREMTLEDTSTHYSNIFTLDIANLPGWKNSKEMTQKRILDSAEEYLKAKSPFNSEHLYDGSANEKDAAVYKAFLMLLNFRSERIIALPNDVWEHWLPVLFGPFDSGDKKDFQKVLVSMAYERVPDGLADVLKQIVFHQINEKNSVSSIHLVEELWDQRIGNVIFSLLSEAQAKPSCWRQLLEALVKNTDARAIGFAKEMLSIPLPENDVHRQLFIQAAIVLIQYTEDSVWSIVWSVFQENREFGREIIMEIAHSVRHNLGKFISKLTEEELADLFTFLVEEFPYFKDREYNGFYSPTKDDAARELRDGLISALKKAGTSASCQAIEHISAALPNLDWIRYILIEARKNTLRQTWMPLKPKDFLQLALQPQVSLVRNAGELQEVLTEILLVLEQKLQGETPAAPDLWDQVDRTRGHEKFIPKDEHHLSDWIKRHLESDLISRGIVVAREVEIRRGEGSGTGERTDIHVTAVVPSIIKGAYDQVRVIIETKGCWHRELQGAMKTQLIDRYLKDNDCHHGIYLVGWYICNQWDDGDYRKRDTPKWSLQEARDFFQQQANDFSENSRCIHAVVISAALR